MLANTKIVSDETSAQLSFGSGSSADVFKSELKALLRGALGMPDGSTRHMAKYLYSSIVPEGYRDSGADLYNRVTMLGNDHYYIPQAEARLIYFNRTYLENLFEGYPTVIDLGAGGDHATMSKMIPTLQGVRAAHYIAFDINESFAVNAAELVKRRMPGIGSHFIHGDFTEFRPIEAASPVLMAMYGCTLSQFSLTKKKGSTESTCEEVLSNLGRMVDHNAILIATIDTNAHPMSAKDCYIGQYMDQFQRHFWLHAKAVIESSSNIGNNHVWVEGNNIANPADAVYYDPRFEDGAIVHSFLTKKDMTFVIDGECFNIGRGTVIDIGVSEKWSAIGEIDKRAKKAGWSIVNELTDSKHTVRALVLAGKNVSEAQKKKAARRSFADIQGGRAMPAGIVEAHRSPIQAPIIGARISSPA